MKLKSIQYNDYQKESNQIASDSSGDIYKVRDIKTGKYYSSKFYIETNGGNKEIDIISKLNHPSILKFNGFCQTPDFFAISDSLIQNNLETVLNSKKPLPEWNDTKKLIVIYGVASAMAHIHSEGIIYCRLIPRNILLDEKFHPKISDFSCARRNDDDDDDDDGDNDDLIKENEYLAPEVLSEKRYSKEGDVFSFGVIIYIIFYNRIPFRNSQTLRIKRPDFSGSINSSFENLIMKCWDDNPSNRPTFEEITKQLLEDKDFITESTNEEEFLNYAKSSELFLLEKNKVKNIKEITTFIKETESRDISDADKSTELSSPKKNQVKKINEITTLIKDAESKLDESPTIKSKISQMIIEEHELNKSAESESVKSSEIKIEERSPDDLNERLPKKDLPALKILDKIYSIPPPPNYCIWLAIIIAIINFIINIFILIFH